MHLCRGTRSSYLVTSREYHKAHRKSLMWIVLFFFALPIPALQSFQNVIQLPDLFFREISLLDQGAHHHAYGAFIHA